MVALAACGDDHDTSPLDASVSDLSEPALCTFDAAAEAPLPEPEPEPELHTPRWAFRPWISKDISDRDDTLEFVQGFLDRDIPIGTVVLDSPWETHYNTFIPSPTRYPDFPGLIASLREDDVHIPAVA